MNFAIGHHHGMEDSGYPHPWQLKVEDLQLEEGERTKMFDLQPGEGKQVSCPNSTATFLWAVEGILLFKQVVDSGYI